MVLPQFAHYGSPVFEFSIDTTEYHWNLVLRLGLGRTGIPKGGSEEPGLGWLGSVGKLLAFHFLRPRVTSVNPSPCVADDMVGCKI